MKNLDEKYISVYKPEDAEFKSQVAMLTSSRQAATGKAYESRQIGDTMDSRKVGDKLTLTGKGEFNHEWKVNGRVQYGSAFEAVAEDGTKTWVSQRALMQQRNIDGYTRFGECTTYTDSANTQNERKLKFDLVLTEQGYKEVIPAWPTRDEVAWYLWATQSNVLKDAVITYQGMCGRPFKAREGNRATENGVPVEAGAQRCVTLKVWTINL